MSSTRTVSGRSGRSRFPEGTETGSQVVQAIGLEPGQGSEGGFEEGTQLGD